MKSIEKCQKRFMFVAIACVLAAGLAMGQPALAADVQINATGLTVFPGAVQNFDAMTVRIAGPSGALVLNEHSAGEAVVWYPAGMPDGMYHYEAIIIIYNSEADSGGDKEGESGESLEKTAGSFEVRNGAIILPKRGGEKTSMLEWLEHTVVRLVGGALDLLVPSAHAANLRAFSVVNPKVWFDETDGGFNPDWSIAASGDNATDIPECGGNTLGFGIFDNTSNNCRKVLEFRKGSISTNTFISDTSGDIRLANNAFFIDRSAQFAAVGTTTPGPEEFTVASTNPELALLDESDNSTVNLQFDGGVFALEGTAGEQDIVRIFGNAPSNSFTIASNGRVGFGTSSPVSALEVRRSNGTAAIKVDENSGFVTKRQMFVLENNGALSFRLIDRNTGSTWQFDTTDNPPVGNFAINNVEAGGRELLLTKAGNMVLKGNLTAAGVFYPSDRKMKDNIEPLDGRDVLSKVMELPISSWNFKKDSDKRRHIGPMAQDFQKIFGGGPDDRHISAADSSGIALAAIQGLGEMVKARDAQIVELQKEITELRMMVQQIAATN